MRIAIFSHALHYIKDETIFSYGPYVREMNLWIKNFEEVRIYAPILKKNPSEIDLSYDHANLKIIGLPSLSFKKNGLVRNFLEGLETVYRCFQGMKGADHIHLRCPGNTGMLALMISSLFPNNSKTIKYAGNWDPESVQPLSYRFQKWWLSNKWLTRNAKVLVYGKWKEQSSQIVPFFTASFSEKQIVLEPKNFEKPWKFIYVGSLSPGKNPLFAIQLVQELRRRGQYCKLSIYGEGPEKNKLHSYIMENSLDDAVELKGNCDQETLILAYKNHQYAILASESEGWPKALAEAMFFGCIPIATKISCVPWMLGEGKRGLLIDVHLERAVNLIQENLNHSSIQLELSDRAMRWSHQYTLEKFELEIQKLL